MQHMKGKDRKRMRRSARKLSALALAAILACTNAASCVNVSYAAELSDKESEDSDSRPAENGGNESSEQDADSGKTESEDSGTSEDEKDNGTDAESEHKEESESEDSSEETEDSEEKDEPEAEDSAPDEESENGDPSEEEDSDPDSESGLEEDSEKEEDTEDQDESDENSESEDSDEPTIGGGGYQEGLDEEKPDGTAPDEIPEEDEEQPEDEEETLEEELPEEELEEEAEKPEFDYTEELDGIFITVAAEEGVLPEGTTVEITQLDENLATASDAEEEPEDSEEEELAEKSETSFCYDITLYDEDGEKLDNSWSRDGLVTVSFSGEKIEELKAVSEKAEIFYVGPKGKEKKVKTISFKEERKNLADDAEDEETDAETADIFFDAEHFSVYRLAFEVKNNIPTKAGSFEELAKVFKAAQDKAKAKADPDTTDSPAAQFEEYTVTLTDDIDVPDNEGALTFEYCKIIIDGAGHTITYKSDVQDDSGILKVRGRGELELSEVTITSEEKEGEYPLIFVGGLNEDADEREGGGGSLIIQGSVNLIDHTNTASYPGGAIAIQGGQVYMWGDSLIENCASQYGLGGAVGLICDKSLFEMNIGKIVGCTAEPNKLTIAGEEKLCSFGGGIYSHYGTSVTITDTYSWNANNMTTIRDNQAVCGGGAAVFGSKKFKLSGGKIIENQATFPGDMANCGGGIYLNGSTVAGPDLASLEFEVNVDSWTEIELDIPIGRERRAKEKRDSNINIEYGEISKNTAGMDDGSSSDAYGGGIYVEGNKGNPVNLNISSGIGSKVKTSISNNKAIGKNAAGGGILVKNAALTVSDNAETAKRNKIYNNQADTEGADICGKGADTSIVLPKAEGMNVYCTSYPGQTGKIDGWYKDSKNKRYIPNPDGTAETDLTFTGETALVAAFKGKPVYTITFNPGDHGVLNDLGPNESVSGTYKEGAAFPKRPSAQPEEGYLFDGWYDEQGQKVEEGDFPSKVTKDAEYTARWKAKEYTVTFKPGDHGTLKGAGADGQVTGKYKHGDKFPERPETAAAEGYLFDGWMDEADQNTVEIFPETVTKDAVYIARWKAEEKPEPVKKTGDLKVSVTVSGSGASKEKAFDFTVVLTGAEADSVNGRYGDMDFQKGTASFSLKHGQSRKAEGLPAGLSYKVTESNYAGYTVSSLGSQGSIPEDNLITAVFDNYKSGGGSSGGGGGNHSGGGGGSHSGGGGSSHSGGKNPTGPAAQEEPKLPPTENQQSAASPHPEINYLPVMGLYGPSLENQAAGQQTAQQQDGRQVIDLLAAQHSQNPDLAGWLTVPGTGNGYPVMYTPGNWEYYLHHNFQKQQDRAGIPFLGEGCVIGGDNTLIHGHNMNGVLQFGYFWNYTSPDFCSQNPTIDFKTIYDGNGAYEVMAVFFAPVYPAEAEGVFKWYQYVGELNEAQFSYYVEQAKAASLYDTGVTAEYGDKLITLETCADNHSSNRLVVVARKKAQPQTN